MDGDFDGITPAVANAMARHGMNRISEWGGWDKKVEQEGTEETETETMPVEKTERIAKYAKYAKEFQWKARPHPGPLLQGEGGFAFACFACFAVKIVFSGEELGQLSGLATKQKRCQLAGMGSADLTGIALELPPEERLDLARRLVESVVAPDCLKEAMTDGIHRIEDIATGRVKGLTGEEYRSGLK